MQRITFFIGGMNRGGAERVISILANQYAKDGWNVDIILLLYDQVQYDIDDRIRIINMNGKSTMKVMNVKSWITDIRQYVKKSHPDVIVSFVARINIIVLLATLGIKSKTIVSERNDPSRDGRSLIVDLATKVLYRRAHKIVFQTKRAMKHFGKTIRAKAVIITNPIRVSCLAVSSEKHRIVSVGRLAPQKNHELLVRAFADVVKKHPEYELWIYGDGDLKDRISELAQKLSVDDKLYLPGNVTNIHSQISDAEMFVLSSDYEGLSNALLEAMMMGLPCISTNCAGTDEYIKSGINGIITSVGNQQELYQAINTLIENTQFRNEIALNGKRSIIKCRSDLVVQQWKVTIEN